MLRNDPSDTGDRVYLIEINMHSMHCIHKFSVIKINIFCFIKCKNYTTFGITDKFYKYTEFVSVIYIFHCVLQHYICNEIRQLYQITCKLVPYCTELFKCCLTLLISFN